MNADVTDEITEIIGKYGADTYFPRELAILMWSNRCLRYWYLSDNLKETPGKKSLKMKDPTGVRLFFG